MPASLDRLPSTFKISPSIIVGVPVDVRGDGWINAFKQHQGRPIFLDHRVIQNSNLYSPPHNRVIAVTEYGLNRPTGRNR